MTKRRIMNFWEVSSLTPIVIDGLNSSSLTSKSSGLYCENFLLNERDNLANIDLQAPDRDTVERRV